MSAVIVAAAVMAGVLGMVSGLAPGWVAFVVLRSLGGVAAASGSPAVTALVLASAPPQRRGLDLGIVQSSTRIMGSLASPIVVTAVAVTGGWRAAILVSGVILIASAGLLVWAVPEDRHARRLRRRVDHDTFALHPGGRRNLMLCVAACVLLLAWLTVWSQSSVSLVQGWLNVSPEGAGRLVGWFGVGSGIGALAIPSLSDRIGRRSALAIAASIGSAGGMATGILAAVGTVPPRGLVLLLLILAGVAMGGLPLVISIIPAEAVATGDVGRALTGPIAGGEILGAATLPLLAAAAAVPLGAPTVLVVAAAGVLAVVALSGLLQPLEPAAG